MSIPALLARVQTLQCQASIAGQASDLNIVQHCSGQPVEATSKIVLAPNRHVSRTQGLHGEQGQNGSAGRADTPIQTQTSRSRHSKAIKPPFHASLN